MTKILSIAAVFAITGGASAQFYGGDFNHVDGLANEYNTDVADAYLFDDFNWPGGTVGSIFGNFLSTIGSPTGFQYEIRSGMSANNGGSLVASGDTDGSFTWAPTGDGDFGYTEFNLDCDVADFGLAPGTYHLGIRPKGDGPGFGERSFISTTSGANSIGSPIGNGNSFFQSGYFGFNYEPTVNVFGTDYDVSQGIRAVPGAGTAGLLGLSGVVAARRRRN